MSWAELQHPTTMAFLSWPCEEVAPLNWEEWMSLSPLNEERPGI